MGSIGAGILSPVRIPVNLYSMAAVYGVIAVFMAFLIRKEGMTQKYYCPVTNGIEITEKRIAHKVTGQKNHGRRLRSVCLCIPPDQRRKKQRLQPKEKAVS